MWNISATALKNTACCSKASAPYSVAEPRLIAAEVITDHVKRGAFSESSSGVEPGFYSPYKHERERVACGINYANIMEMIVDGGFGFHTKVK